MKTIKFDLKLKNGEITLRTLDDLEENLSPELFTHFHTGKLAKWLRVRKLDELAEKMEALRTQNIEDKNELNIKLFKNLCEIFVSEVSEEDAREAVADFKAVEPSVENSNDEEIEQLKAENQALKTEVEQLKNSPKPEPEIKGTKIGKFIVQDGIATDSETGLTWLRFAHGQLWEDGRLTGKAERRNWSDAMKIPAEFNRTGYASHTDWRVPTLKELQTLIDKEHGKSRNQIDDVVFPENTGFRGGDWFWSSHSNYVVQFNYGSTGCGNSGCDYPVRLVRSGQ
jgi:hypothetical protein